MEYNKFYKQNKKIFGKTYNSLSENLGNLFLLFCAYLLIMMMFFSTIYVGVEVDGTSMENSYFNKDIVYYLPNAEYSYGDVVVVKVSENHELLKRVIGLPGDKINFDITLNGESYVYTLTINGKPVIEPYIKTQSGNAMTYENIYGSDENSLINTKPESFMQNEKGEHYRKDLVLGQDQVFVLGDNRQISNDSSSYGAFNSSQIVGRVDFVSSAGKLPVLELLKQFFWPF